MGFELLLTSVLGKFSWKIPPPTQLWIFGLELFGQVGSGIFIPAAAAAAEKAGRAAAGRAVVRATVSRDRLSHLEQDFLDYV